MTIFYGSTAVLTAGLISVSAATLAPSSSHAAQDLVEVQTGTTWFCPMHADVTASAPGRCSKCQMQLVSGNPFDTREYWLDVVTSPAAVKPGVPFKLRLTVRHPGTDEVINAFEEVHDKRYHLFLISQDMSVFEHIHPELRPNGAWEIEATVPKPGYYRVLSDFLPAGGSPQFIGRPLMTSEFEGDAESAQAQLEPDTTFTKTVNSVTANVEFDPAPIVAGQYGHLMFTLTDAATGQSVTDLQPYLGAFGHTLIMSEDMTTSVHSHPTPGPDSDVATGAGGPHVTFEGYFPLPGMYRAWTQFLRHDRLSTFTFTFRVWSLEDAMRR